MKKSIALLLTAAMLLGCLSMLPAPARAAAESGALNPSGADSAATFASILTDGKQYTYNTYVTSAPTDWNELTYNEATAQDIMDYIRSEFFVFDYKFDASGKIIPGDYEVEYSAATSLVDVTAKYADAWGLDATATGYAYAITLRDDLTWDDGTPIKAEDFVYSMQEQLNPLFQNYRADTYYAGTVNLIGAKDYVYQGFSGWFAVDTFYTVYSEDLDSQIIFSLAAPSEDILVECSLRTAMGFPASYDAADVADYLITNCLGECAFTAEVAASMEGKTFAEIKADPTMKAAWDALIGWWQTEPNEELDFFVVSYTYPDVSFDQVGIFVGDNAYEIVIILETPLELLKEDGSLSYNAAYTFSSLPLVKKELYEACKIAPAAEGELWTTNYCTNADTTPSWGPYSLESYRSYDSFSLARNENWFGYQLEAYAGQYQTDKIVYRIIKEWGSAWLKFQAGELDGIGHVADEYSSSSRAFFAPEDFIQSAQLQSDAEALAARESNGVNKTLLTYTDFRQAMSLAVDRVAYGAACTSGAQPSFGIFNSMHYYDVENGGVYRNTDEAKQVLCDVYAVDVSKFESLDAAYASITGYNLKEAKALVESAYQAALADGEISETDKVVLTFGTSADTDSARRHYEYLSNTWIKMVEGTSLESRLEFNFNASFGSNWAIDFRAGAYDICLGGWSGAAWNPGYFLLAYLDDGYRYAQGWDTSAHMMTFTMKGVGKNGADITETMSLIEWYNCLNGLGDCQYDWSSTALAESQRVQLIAALESEILKTYYTVPLCSFSSASMLSYKVDYISNEYNTFLGFGGIRYLTYHYTDEEWEAAVASVGGWLNYKESNLPEQEHTHNYIAVVTAPTCIDEGYTTYICACGDRYVTNEVAALGHRHEPVITDPTCVDAGYTTYTCACGDSYVTDEVPATGVHSYSDGYCENCGALDMDRLSIAFRDTLEDLDMFYTLNAEYMAMRVAWIFLADCDWGESVTVPAAEFEAMISKYFVLTAKILKQLHAMTDWPADYNAEDDTYTLANYGGKGGGAPERMYRGYVRNGDTYEVFYGHVTYAFLSDALPEDISESEYAGQLGWPETIEYEGVTYELYQGDYVHIVSYDDYGRKYTVELNGDIVRILSCVDYTAEDLPEKFDDEVLVQLPEDGAVTLPESDSFADGAVVVVEQVKDEAAQETVADAMETVAEKYVAYEFTATVNGEQSQPQKGLTVVFAIPEGYSNNVTVYYMDADGVLHELEVAVDAQNRTVTVELAHFSTYILADKDTAPAYTPGDADGNGKVNARDVRALLQFLASMLSEDATFVEAAADLDGNGKVNARDVRALLNLLAGIG